MAFSIRALAGLARCERPTSADLNASVVQPGRFAHGPDEKFGLAGFTAGAVRGISAMATLPGRKSCVRARCPEAVDMPDGPCSSMGQLCRTVSAGYENPADGAGLAGQCDSTNAAPLRVRRHQ